jgi:hypothetical protein
MLTTGLPTPTDCARFHARIVMQSRVKFGRWFAPIYSRLSGIDSSDSTVGSGTRPNLTAEFK